jgi:hypothetical protein
MTVDSRNSTSRQRSPLGKGRALPPRVVFALLTSILVTLLGHRRRWIRRRVPALLASQLQLVYDGGGPAARMDQDPDIATPARAAAAALVGAALAR